jgi:hypothetical protein
MFLDIITIFVLTYQRHRLLDLIYITDMDLVYVPVLEHLNQDDGWCPET